MASAAVHPKAVVVLLSIHCLLLLQLFVGGLGSAIVMSYSILFPSFLSFAIISLRKR